MQRAAGQLSGELIEVFKKHGLSDSSYNVLRIVAGHGKDGVPSQQIAPMTVSRLPDVTRLVDRLETKDLVKRRRCQEDRRVTYVTITTSGTRVLKKLNAEVTSIHAKQFPKLTDSELSRLIRLLEKSQIFDV